MQTKGWDKRVTTSLFGMYVVDAWLMYKGCTTASAGATPKLTQKEFDCQLAEELIDNNQDKVQDSFNVRTLCSFGGTRISTKMKMTSTDDLNYS